MTEVWFGVRAAGTVVVGWQQPKTGCACGAQSDSFGEGSRNTLQKRRSDAPGNAGYIDAIERTPHRTAAVQLLTVTWAGTVSDRDRDSDWDRDTGIRAVARARDIARDSGAQ